MGVREREGRQEGEGLVARFATAAPHPNPIVIMVMSLLGAAAVANDRMAQTRGHCRGILPGSAQSTWRLYCASESEINRVVVMRALPGLVTCYERNRAKPSAPH